MRKYNKLMIIIAIVGSLILAVFFLFSLFRSGNKEEFFSNYVGFYINFLILVIFFMVNKIFPFFWIHKKESLKKIGDLNEKELDSNKENISIHTGKKLYISYDVFIDRDLSKKILSFWIIVSYIPFIFIILGMFPLPCPNIVENLQIIKNIFCNTTCKQFFELIIMTFASVFNIIFLLLCYYEKGKIYFFIVDLSKQEYIKNVEKINKKYNDIMTNIILNESIEYVNDNPYYCVQYMKYKKRYRIIYCIAVVAASLYIIFHIFQFMNGRNNVFITNFPNILLIMYCIFSTDYYKRGLHHQIEIFDENIDIKSKNVYKQLIYYIRKKEGNMDRVIQKEINIIENNELKAMKLYNIYRKKC